MLGAHVVVVDDLSGGARENLEPFGAASGGRLEFVQGSLLDPGLLKRCAQGCRWIFHQAAAEAPCRAVCEDPVRCTTR